MACQLRAAGHEVAHLAIVDALAPLANRASMGSFETFAVLSFAHDLGVSAAGLNMDELIQLTPSQRFAAIFERAKAERIVTDDDRTRVRQLFEISEHNRMALARYTGQSYMGDILLLRASESEDPLHDPLFGWGELTEGKIESYVLPGNHFSILAEPSVQQVARILKESVRPLQVVNSHVARSAAIATL
jgi:thioesterase domain-containing protein